MSNTLDESRTRSPAPLPAILTRLDRPAWALAAVLAASTLARFTVGAGQPLWLDETWTGMIASQPSLAEAARQAWYDANAPLFYLVSWLWAWPAGVSDAALRLPATIFGALAPLVALAPAKLADRRTRFVWCALMACWIPALSFSQDARGYTLLLLLGALNAVTFAALLARPSLGAALRWSLVGSLLVLTHYYAGLLIACQGIAYLAVGRGRAAATWPALFGFAPAAGWMAVHVPRMAVYTRPGVAWQPLMTLADLPAAMAFLAGSAALASAVALWALGAVILGRRAEAADAADAPRTLWVVAAASLGAVLVAVGLGFVRPSFVLRYLTPFVPGLLLGLALVAGRFARRWPLAPATLVAVFVAGALGWAAQAPAQPARLYAFGAASDTIAEAGATRLVFLWDHPATPFEDPSQLAKVGGFFLRRAGHAVPVDPVRLKPGEDPNLALLSRAAPGGSAILWLYDRQVPGTAAARTPPRLAALDPALRCRDFGRGDIGVLACTRPATPPARGEVRS